MATRVELEYGAAESSMKTYCIWAITALFLHVKELLCFGISNPACNFLSSYFFHY
jgi:hypothetical protein